MAKAGWKRFPHDAKAYAYPGDALKKHWARLHKGDCEPFPKDAAAQEAWRAFHAGDFERALTLGVEAGGGAAMNAANKAACIYATYLEPADAKRVKLFQEAAERILHRTGRRRVDVALHRREMDDVLAHLFQDRPGLGEGRIGTAHHERQRTGRGTADATGHGRIDHGEACRR